MVWISKVLKLDYVHAHTYIMDQDHNFMNHSYDYLCNNFYLNLLARSDFRMMRERYGSMLGQIVGDLLMMIAVC